MPDGKIHIGTSAFLYPMPVTLLGATVRGRANFMALGWITRANASPPMLAAGVHRSHFTLEGIREHGTFSINVPHAGMMADTDYCGIVSGKDTDKSAVFDLFYGKLETAPMIRACPLCMECRLVETVSLPTNDLLVGEIIASYCSEECITDGRPDIKKIDPLLLTMPDNTYWGVGERRGSAWNAGRTRMRNEKASVRPR